MYLLADETFETKTEIERRCRHIIDNTQDSKPVFDRFVPLLADLFAYLDDWPARLATMKHIVVHKTPQGARCFATTNRMGCSTSISFLKAINLMFPDQEKPIIESLPMDYQLAAKASIESDLREYQLKQFLKDARCPVSGVFLTYKNSTVEYFPPWTFDHLLYRFTEQNEIDPNLAVEKFRFDSSQMQLAECVAKPWREFHRKHARLMLVSLCETKKSLSTAEPVWTTLWP